jgi:hypothetical protein
VKKTIQKRSEQKKQVLVPAACPGAGSVADASGYALHSWVPGDQVMDVYGDGAKELPPLPPLERSACMPALTMVLSMSLSS